MSEWKDMKDAPKDGRKVIVYHEEYGVAIVYRECGRWISAQGYLSHHYGDAIAWMELPDPPKKKHFCEHPERKEWICQTYPGNKFRLSMGSYWITVSYCPFCGEPAEKKHE